MSLGYSASDYTQEARLRGEWERAYLRFETPEQEARKFQRRLVTLGARAWSREAAIIELFCGRGGGLTALAGLGFHNIRGVDLSASLVARYRGPGQCLVGDCRHLPFKSGSQTVAVVQGGLHHLDDLTTDLDRALAEIRRVLRADGLLVVVEPWLTPFLRAVHAIAGVRIACRVWPRLAALATMIRLEGTTYRRWLARPEWILVQLGKHFIPLRSEAHWGKLLFLGRKRPYEDCG